MVAKAQPQPFRVGPNGLMCVGAVFTSGAGKEKTCAARTGSP